MRHSGDRRSAKAVCTWVGSAALIALTVSVAADPATGSAEADTMNWDAVAECESGGDWSADTGNGFYGGLQFKQSTWAENGGVGSPAKAPRDQQIAVANRVLATQGPAAWPKCGGNQTLFPPELVDILRWGHPLRGTWHKLWSKAIPH